MTKHRAIVVGGGLAGLAATMKIAEQGMSVLLVSFLPVKRSHSVCAQGGINGAVNIKGEGDSPEIHFYDTVKGGDFLGHQPICKDMCYHAPFIIYLRTAWGFHSIELPREFRFPQIWRYPTPSDSFLWSHHGPTATLCTR